MREDTSQQEGIHFKTNSMAAPVINKTTIKIVMVMMLMANLTATIVDVQGGLLKRKL